MSLTVFGVPTTAILFPSIIPPDSVVPQPPSPQPLQG